MVDLEVPGRQPTLSQRVAEVLRRRILSGELIQGERINEVRLATELQTSRGPIREALKQLSAEGLLKDEPRRGAFVRRLSPEDAAEIYQLRTALEVQAARMVMLKGRQRDVEMMATAAQKVEVAAHGGDPEEAARRDLEFHATLCRLSGNNRILALFQTNAALLQRLLLTANADTILDEMLDGHRAIVDSLRSGSFPRAEKAIVSHLEEGQRRVAKYLQKLSASPGASAVPKASASTSD